MGQKVDTVLRAARLLRESLSNAGKIAADELSRRSAGQEPWTAVKGGLEKLLARSGRPSSPPVEKRGGEATPPAQDPPGRPRTPDQPESTAPQVPASVPDAVQTTAELRQVDPDLEPEPLSSNPWVDMLSLRTRNRLSEGGITTLADLEGRRVKDLLAIHGFGLEALEEVNRFLSAQNLPPVNPTARSQSSSWPAGEASQSRPSPPPTAPLDSNPFFGILSVRTRRLLASAGISSLADLQRADRESLLALKGFGVKCLAEVEKFVEANGLPVTEFAPPAASAGQFAKEALRFEALSEQAQTSLRKIGVSAAEDLMNRGLLEVLEATGYDQRTTDEIGLMCGLPAPQDENELLALLYASNIARDALARAARPTSDSDIDDKAMVLQDKVSEQIRRGTLHEHAAMDWVVLQTLNQRFRPPAHTLPDLLQRLQYYPDRKVLDAINQLDAAIEIASLEEELDLLFGQLDEREVEVVRQRLAVGHRRTLEEVGAYFGVTRERIRQIEKQAAASVRKIYYWEMPLLRMRTAMLLIREKRAFALRDMIRLFGDRGLATSEAAVNDLLIAWRALDLADSGLHDTLVQWKVVDPQAYAFPGEILSVAKTGLDPRLQRFSQDVTRVARRLSSRIGAVTPAQIVEALDAEERPTEEDVVAILSKTGFREVVSDHWVDVREEYSIPREVVTKMLATCGPLSLRQLRRGLLRHQKRLGYPVPPVTVLGPVLAHQSMFEVNEEGLCNLKTPALHSLYLGLAERVWLDTVKTNGPVVHAHTILRAFRERNLKKVTAYRLMMDSPLVQKVGKQLFSLPGANITDADVAAGREQAIRRSSGRTLAAPGTVRKTEEPATVELEALRDDPQKASEDPQEASGPITDEPVWARLQYEAAENRLVMRMAETAWQGDVDVRLSWDGQEFDIPSSYTPSEDTTTSGLAKLSVNEPFWQTEGLLVAGRGQRVVRFPRPPLTHALVIRASDGKALGRWRAGEEHYVVLPTERVSEEHAAEIFEEWHSLGPPEGWEAFTVLWVRTKDPLGRDSAQGRCADAAAVIDAFSRATTALGLPDFDFHWRPRPRMVGGGPLGTSEGREIFAADHPPYLEVNGLWDSPLEVALSRWMPGGAEFVKETSLRVPPSAEGSCLLEVWGTGKRPREGRYRVEVGRQQVEFEIATSVPLPARGRPTVDLALRKDDENLSERGLTRRDLDHGTLVGRAWPGARLVFTASSGTWSHTFGVTADDEGHWSARWRDLGVSEVPGGLLKLELSWRSLIGSALVAADGPFVAEDDVELSFRVRGPEKFLGLSGAVSNAGEHRLARAVLLGSRPWAGEIWTQEARVDERGAFETLFRDVDGEVRWLLILPGERAPEDDAQRPWLIQAQSEDVPLTSYPLEQLQGERRDSWKELADELRSVALPSALERFLGLSDLGEVLERVPEAPAGRSRWTPVGEPSDLRRLLSWKRFGMRTPIAVFSSAAPVIGSPPNETLPPLLTVAIEALAESLDRGTGQVPLECVTHDGHRRRIKGFVVPNEADGEIGFELRVGELLYGCPRCGLILPPGEFSNHPPPGKGMPSCTAIRLALQLISAGKTRPVTLVLLADTEKVGSSMRELVRRVVTGDEDDVPDHAAPWLDLLQEAYFGEGGEQEPEDWLDALYSLHARLVSVRRCGGSEVELADLGRSVRRHGSGLDVLSRWLKSEVG